MTPRAWATHAERLNLYELHRRALSALAAPYILKFAAQSEGAARLPRPRDVDIIHCDLKPSAAELWERPRAGAAGDTVVHDGCGGTAGAAAALASSFSRARGRTRRRARSGGCNGVIDSRAVSSCEAGTAAWVDSYTAVARGSQSPEEGTGPRSRSWRRSAVVPTAVPRSSARS